MSRPISTSGQCALTLSNALATVSSATGKCVATVSLGWTSLAINWLRM